MEDNSKVEVDKKVIEEFYKMAKMEMPEDVSEESLKQVMEKIKDKESKADEKASSDENASAENTTGDNPSADPANTTTKNILVIDDIGVVTYQLRVLLQNLGYSVNVAKDIFNGINSFVRSVYSFVIMDLFVSTEQEGYTLLNETKKIITENNLDTKIIVITASSKTENRVRCMNGGADFFIKKDVGWQDKLIELIENNQA